MLPDAHPQNMHVGGSKGSISGNHAMANGELLIVVGSRAVCQADCSGVGYPKAQAVININADLGDATHYNRTLALVGDIGVVIGQLLDTLGKNDGTRRGSRTNGSRNAPTPRRSGNRSWRSARPAAAWSIRSGSARC